MFCPADVLIDDIARDSALTVSFGYLTAQFLAGKQSPALSKAQCPFRRHNGFARQAGILTDDFFIIFSEDEIINHFAIRCFEAIVVTALGTELELCLIRIIQKDAIAIAAHKERDALVEGVFHNAVTGFIAVPHLIGFAAAVQFACLLTQAEEVFVPAEGLVFHFAGSFADVTLIGIVAEQEFLILVEYLEAERGFVDPDAEFGCKYLITGILLVHLNGAHIFQFFIDDGRVSPLQFSVRRKPDTHHRRAA